ncbi:MAG: hypothetical protein K8R36_05670 [Planctomycetales bacterium]|nr:hypothetical protein [Planctomycetales bacterium]
MAPFPMRPTTKRQPVVDTYHGKAITDGYRWLEGGKNRVNPKYVTWA